MNRVVELAKSEKLLADVPMWQSGEALNFKPSSTRSSKTLASQDLGDSESQPLTPPDSPPASQRFAKRSRLATTLESSSSETQSLGFDTAEDCRISRIVTSGARGVQSRASTSSVLQVPASQLQSTMPLVTNTFTLSQAQRLFGSTATQAKVFSSLTSLMETFRAKYSYGFWTVILTRLLSKEGSSTLATLASYFAPTTTTTSTSVRNSSDDSDSEDFMCSTSDEETILISSGESEERSGSESEYQRYPIKRSQLRREQRRMMAPPEDSEEESD